ncbi:DUF935 family protein [Shinella sp. HZN7]|uniref:phage portal protein family protein n=1 Tax=Shinella sp. (strain HZN7) TaxID=879274 RepID=UPI000A0360EA|nr:DUF935 family protein [Shinella sp. HZN7]
MLVANVQNDITIPFFSGALQHADDTLLQRGGGKGLKIYDEIKRDTHASACLAKRNKQLIARDWEVNGASEAPRDIEAADFVRDVVNGLPFDRLCEELSGGALLKGFAVSEVVWSRKGDRIVPERIVSHDQRRFAFGQDSKPRLRTWTNINDGVELPDRKFIVHRHGVIGNNPYGLGLGHQLFWAVLFKREGVAFWLHFLDKYAGPTAIAQTPYGMISEEQQKLLNDLAAIRTSSAITVPIGTDVKFLEAARSGNVSYQDWLTYWDKQISICILGETLTTDIGSSGSRSAAETHADMLSMLVDSDADHLSDTLYEQLVAWLVDYNFPGAGVPRIWRVRPKNEKAKAETRKSRAEAATSEHSALVEIVSTAAKFDDDDVAREFIVSFELTHALSDTAIDRLVEARFAFMEGGKRDRDLRQLAKENPTFAALFGPVGVKKNFSDGVTFAVEPDPVEELTDRVEELAAGHFTRRLDAIKAALDAAADFPAATRAILQLGAKWSPIALGNLLGDALELAALRGREAVFLDGEDETDFADAEVFNQPFKEQIEFFRQKRGKPTKVWTDALRGTHDRAFVIAGATDLAMLSEFQTAIADAMEKGTTLEAFRGDFDRIVAKHGWAYKGERGWRTRVIFETNMRTSHMAGRLKQMRDPDVLKLRPIWEYRHGETRRPKFPRRQHEAWHRMCLAHDDPFWLTHFPPNDWLCSCGVRSRSWRDLKRMGKELDESPAALMEPVIDPVSGKLIEQPQGVGIGWDYMPGDLWERGLVPSSLMDEGRELLDNPRMVVAIDEPEPVADLLKSAKPFKAQLLEDGLQPEDYVRTFLKPFGADIDQGVLFEDKAGAHIPVSDQLFRNREGQFKALKRNRHRVLAMMAEALLDPDEIWMGVARKVESGDLVVDRRYIRVDPKTAIQIVFEIGEKTWEAITSFDFTDKKGAADFAALEKRRVGKLVYKRPKK